jgi:hypothetical protein
MNLDSINTFSNILTDETVNILHHKLLSTPRWLVSTNRYNIETFQRAEEATDNGFIMCTYEDKSKDYTMSPDDNDDKVFQDLNFFASLILEVCIGRCYEEDFLAKLPLLRNISVTRYFWNYYHNTSKGTFHQDIDELNHWSIIFYINDCPNSGTTIIDEEGKEHLIPHVANTAVMFPANLTHKGLSPEKNKHRCCLNILFKADKIKNRIMKFPNTENKG